MSLGAVGTSSANLALWGKLQASLQNKNVGDTGETQKSTPAAAPPAQHRVSGASPSSGGSLIDVKT
jgi:hypothetical protein